MANLSDAIDDHAMTHPRSRIAEIILADAPEHLDADAVRGVLDASWSATESACLSGVALLEFDEYREVSV